MAVDAPKIKIPVEADITEAQKNLDKLSSTIDKSMGKSSGVINNFKKNWAGIAAGFGASAISLGMFVSITAGFEQAVANVASVSGDAKKDIADLAREMGEKTVFSAREAADAMYFLSSAGLKVADQTKVLPNVLNVASAAQIGLAEATDMVVNNLKTFGAEMSDSQRFGDVMVKTVQASNTDLGQLGEALSYTGGIAKSFGVSFEDINAILGTLADNGIKGSKAGSQLRQAFAQLAAPSEKASKILKQYGITQEELNGLLPKPIELFKRLKNANLDNADAIEILGVQQASLINIINNSTDKMGNLRNMINESGGAAENAAKTQIDTLEGSLKLLNSAFEELLISGSEDGGLRDMLKSIVDMATNAVQVFSGMPGPLKAITIAIVVLTPAILALNAALGPTGLIILGVAAAATGLAFVIGGLNWKGMGESAETLAEAFGDMADEIERANDAMDAFEKGEFQRYMDDLGISVDDINKKLKRTTGNMLELGGATKTYDEKAFRLAALELGIERVNGQITEQQRLINKGVGDIQSSSQIYIQTAEQRQATERGLNKLIELRSKLEKMWAEEKVKQKPIVQAIEEANKRTEQSTKKMSDEEIEALQRKMELYKEATMKGIVFQKTFADLSIKEIERELKAWEDAMRRKVQALEYFNNFAQAGFQLVGAIMDNYYQNGIDRSNEYQEQLTAMDEEDRIRQEEQLARDIEALAKSESAEDQKARAEKERELKRMQLEDESEKRKRQIAHDESVMNRKRAIADKIGAILGITVKTAQGIMNAMEAFWITGGMPWAAIIGAMGAVEIATASAAPLPPIISAAKGGSMITSGPTGLIVGDNPSGRELVSVRPMENANEINEFGSSDTYNLYGDIVLPVQSDVEMFASNLKKYLQSRGQIG